MCCTLYLFISFSVPTYRQTSPTYHSISTQEQDKLSIFPCVSAIKSWQRLLCGKPHCFSKEDIVCTSHLTPASLTSNSQFQGRLFGYLLSKSTTGPHGPKFTRMHSAVHSRGQDWKSLLDSRDKRPSLSSPPLASAGHVGQLTERP